jgi:hypothetical protein
MFNLDSMPPFVNKQVGNVGEFTENSNNNEKAKQMTRFFCHDFLSPFMNNDQKALEAIANSAVIGEYDSMRRFEVQEIRHR